MGIQDNYCILQWKPMTAATCRSIPHTGAKYTAVQDIPACSVYWYLLSQSTDIHLDRHVYHELQYHQGWHLANFIVKLRSGSGY